MDIFTQAWHQYATANNLYHLAAFCLTGAASVYTVQLIKLVKNDKYGKKVYQGLNFLFNSLYTAAGAILAGGITLGNGSKTALALTAFSAGYYRFHNSLLFKRFDSISNNTPATGVDAPTVSSSQFSS